MMGASTGIFCLSVKRSAFVDVVRSNRHRPNGSSVHIKCCAQIVSNVHRVNGTPVVGGEPVDFVRAETGIEWVLFENLKGHPGLMVLFARQLAPTPPEGFGGAEAIVH